MGINESIIYGLLALCAVLAGLCLLKKKPLVSTLMGEGAIALAAMSAKNWLLALADSGKNTAYLGFERYPLVSLALVLILAAALICIAAGLILFVKQQLGTKE